jgi:hypothetical protein
MGDKIAGYSVEEMRVIVPKGKVAAKNPDRLATVTGNFRNLDEKGQPTGDTLSFHSKEITKAMGANPLTKIDRDNGILILPAGERGRKPAVSEDQDSIDALLASVREDAEVEAEEVATVAAD